MNNFEKPIIIFDTDMDTDCDDAGAFAILLEAHRLAKIELLGAISDSVSRYAAPCCDMMARFYNVNIPVGAIYADDYMDTDKNVTRFAPYREHSAYCAEKSMDYNRVFAEKINKTDRDYKAAAKMYRELLTAADDRSVTVLCVGMLTAIAEALATAADEISPLSGVELFRKKVNRIISMGNLDKTNDFNWGMDAYATEQFFSLCPVPIYVSSAGTDVVTGENLTSALESDHPLRRAYEIWLRKENCGRSSWDLIATLYAINSDTPYLIAKDCGCFKYDKDKKLPCKDESGAECNRIYLNCETDTMVKLLNKLMLGDFGDVIS